MLQGKPTKAAPKVDTDEETIWTCPETGRCYRQQVSALAEALSDPAQRTEALANIRTLVDQIVLTPEVVRFV